MAFVGNLFWFLCGGLFMALGWLILGLLMCCTIIGIPFGIASFRIASFAAFPFGKELVDARLVGEDRITGTGLANFLWIILAGFWLALGHIFSGLACFLFFFLIFPIAFGLAHFKLAQASFAPLGKRIVSKHLAEAAKTRHAHATLDKKLQRT
jgi:uncharacterized membrane protein YccF (DUF307 family)